MNTYGYVSGNPLSYIDPLGLYQCTCRNISGGGGNGSTISGRKQFNYSCTCKCANGKSYEITITGGSQGGNAQGQTALGSDLKTGVARDGRTYTYAAGFNNFQADTDAPWYQVSGRGEPTLNFNIEVEMSGLCETCQ